MKKTKIYVAIPTMGEVVDVMMYAFRQYERDYGDRIEFVYPEHCVQRRWHDFARNAIVEDFLKTDADMLWFLDSDIIPPPNVLDLVTDHGQHWDMAGAPYPVFMTVPNRIGPQVVMCVYNRDENGGMHTVDVPTEGRGFVDGMATGCIFIKREVFAKLQKPYFEFKFDPETRKMTEGEDLGFCRKTSELGLKFFTDFSMACGHVKKVNLLDVNNYAIQFANQSVKTYDNQVRDQVVALAKKVKEQAMQLAELKKPKSGLILPDRLK